MDKVQRRDMSKEYPINSIKLIQYVRAHECLYNQAADGYTDKTYKEMVWETINKALFSNYEALSDSEKNQIRSHVRRRWKGLRDALARQAKKSATMENYCRRQDSPMLVELEFLIPHIKSTYCARLADEMNLRNDTYYISHLKNDLPNSDSSDQISTDYDNSYDMIDLTAEEEDFKPYIKMEPFHTCTTFESQSISPTVQVLQNYESMSVPVAPTELVCAVVPNNVAAHNYIDEKGSENSNWNTCTMTEFKEGEFTTMMCSNESESDSYDLNNPSSTESASPLCNSSEANDAPQDELTNLKTRIVKLLNEMEKREGSADNAQQQQQQQQNNSEEERMFLLSLVPDLKRVPAAKKMTVKAEIVMAIAKAIDKN